MTKKLTITKKVAISECKKLWKEIEESGLSKNGYLFHSKAGRKWLNKDYRASCPLCKYAKQVSRKSPICHSCPLWKQYGKCCWRFDYNIGAPEWYTAVRGLK